MTQIGRKVLVFGMSSEDLMQVVPMESNNALVANLPDSGCVTHPVQNSFQELSDKFSHGYNNAIHVFMCINRTNPPKYPC